MVTSTAPAGIITDSPRPRRMHFPAAALVFLFIGALASAAQPAAPIDRPAALADWPRTVALKSAPVVTVISEDKAQKEFIYESEHYRFVCDSMLDANLVREFSRVFEAAWLANSLLPLDLKPSPEGDNKKFLARIFTDESDYHEIGGPEGSAGVYIPQAKALMLPLSSLGVKMFGTRVIVNYGARDYSTLIHETTHQLMNHWLPQMPVWFVEGSAEYIALAKYDSGHFSFIQQDKRLQERLLREGGGGRFQMVPLEKLMTLSFREWIGELKSEEHASRNYSSALALTYYFYHLDDDGKGTHIKEYVRAVQQLAPGEDSAGLVEKYLLRGRDYETLQKSVQQSLRRIGINVDFAE